MPQKPSGRRAVGLLAAATLIAAVLASAIPPPSVRAAASVPAELNAIRLDSQFVDAAVADVDGDGTRDLVAILPWAKDTERLAVEVIAESRAGTWLTTGQVPLRRRISAAEQRNGTVPDADGMRPALVSDRARIVSWHAAGRERALIAVNAGTQVGEDGACCLAVWTVVGLSPTGVPQLRSVADDQRRADAVLALDMDGDGVQELVVHEPAGPSGPPAALTMLRWDAPRARFTSQTLSRLNAGDPTEMSVLGDSDGLPGDEVAFVGTFAVTQAQPAYGMTRISLRAGALHAERTDLPASGTPLAVGVEDGAPGPEILLGDVHASLTAYAWPAEGSLRRLAGIDLSGRPAGILGSGPKAQVVIDRGLPTGAALVGANLDRADPELVSVGAAGRAMARSTFLPYVGPWPIALADGTMGFVVAGNLLGTEPGAVGEARPMATLGGMLPLGSLGNGGSEVAMLQSLAGPTDRGDRRGGRLLNGDEYSVTIASIAQVLAPEADDGVLDPPTAAVIDPRQPDGSSVFVGPRGIDATVVAPSGSVAESHAGSESTVEVLSERIAVGRTSGTFPFRVPMELSGTTPGNKAYDAALYLVTPAGHGYHATWRATALREPPTLTASAPFLSLGLDAEITGTTDPAATVLAGERRATVDADGRFHVSVPAGLSPQDVQLVASDPFGHVSRAMVSVVAPLDYRRVPWIPIASVLTLLGIGIVFLRRPGGAVPAPRGADEGTFEEFEP